MTAYLESRSWLRDDRMFCIEMLPNKERPSFIDTHGKILALRMTALIILPKYSREDFRKLTADKESPMNKNESADGSYVKRLASWYDSTHSYSTNEMLLTEFKMRLSKFKRLFCHPSTLIRIVVSVSGAWTGKVLIPSETLKLSNTP